LNYSQNKEYLVVFIVVQNLVGFGAVVFDKSPILMFCEFGLKMPIHAFFWFFLGVLAPRW